MKPFFGLTIKRWHGSFGFLISINLKLSNKEYIAPTCHSVACLLFCGFVRKVNRILSFSLIVPACSLLPDLSAIRRHELFLCFPSTWLWFGYLLPTSVYWLAFITRPLSLFIYVCSPLQMPFSDICYLPLAYEWKYIGFLYSHLSLFVFQHYFRPKGTFTASVVEAPPATKSEGK